MTDKLERIKQAVNSPVSWTIIGVSAMTLLVFPTWTAALIAAAAEAGAVGWLMNSRAIRRKIADEQLKRADQQLRYQWKMLRDVLTPDDWQRFHRMWKVHGDIAYFAGRQHSAFLRQSLSTVLDQVFRLTQQAGSLLRLQSDIRRSVAHMERDDLIRRQDELEHRIAQTNDPLAKRGFQMAHATTQEALATILRLDGVLDRIEAHLQAIETGLSTIRLRVLLIESPAVLSDVGEHNPIGHALEHLISEANVIEETVRETSRIILRSPLMELPPPETSR